MNLFKVVDDFVKMFVDEYNEAGVAIGNIICWLIIYFVSWRIIGLLGPYLVLLSFPLILTPLFGGSLVWFFYRDERKRSDLLFDGGLFILIFIVLNGIPNVFWGLVFKGLQTKSFVDSYWWVIQAWWKVFNTINPLTDDGFPQEFYVFNYLYAQWIFVLGSIVGAPVVFFYFFNKEKKEIEREREEFERQAREAKEEKLRKALEVKEEEDRKLKKTQEEKKKREYEEKQRKLRKEATDPNPWDSGFL